VNEGTCDSVPDILTPSTYNLPPMANASSPHEVMAGDVVQLDGGGNADPDGDTLSCSWSILSRPEGSMAFLVDPIVACPAFEADVESDTGLPYFSGRDFNSHDGI